MRLIAINRLTALDYIYLSNYIWATENGGTVYKNGCNS